MKLHRLLTAAALAIAGLTALGAAQPERLVAIADIHGDLAAFQRVLHAAGLTDKAGNWQGGAARLVQTGDYTDRGPDVRQIMDLLRSLETSARRAGGRVDVLLGNHEVMNLLAEYRDVNPAVYASFADNRSEARRERAYTEHQRLGERRVKQLKAEPAIYTPRDRQAWMAAHPPGFIEHAEALGPGGNYGRWLRDKAVVLNANGTILMHAGIEPTTAPDSIDAINRAVREEIRRYDAARRYLGSRGIILPFFTLSETLAAVEAEVAALQAGIIEAPDRHHLEMLDVILGIGTTPLLQPEGPLWFRGFATWRDDEGASHITGLLTRYSASRFVTGHTVQREITSRFDHRVFLIDTGMLTAVYKGRPSALEVAGDRITAIYTDGRTVIHDGSAQRAGAAR